MGGNYRNRGNGSRGRGAKFPKRPFPYGKNFHSNKKRKFEYVEKESTDSLENKTNMDHVSDQESTDSEVEVQVNSVSKLLSTFSPNDSDRETDGESEGSDEVSDDAEEADSDDGELEELDEREGMVEDDMSDQSNDDLIEEEELNDESGEEEDLENNLAEDENSDIDTFKKHFEGNLTDDMADQITDIKNWRSNFDSWASLGRLRLEAPQVEITKAKPLLLAYDDDDPPDVGTLPSPPDKDFSLASCHIKPLIEKNIPLANLDVQRELGLLDEQKEILSILSSYADFYYPTVSYKKWNLIRPIYCLHALNHILKTRNKVLSHNAKINKAKAEKKFSENDSYRDQGYSRPKVLILLPFRHSAYKVVHTMIQLLFPGKGDAIQNKKRFDDDFGPGEEDNKRPSNKPDDFQETFKGDIREDFKIGLSITKKSLKLYTEFAQSDIIIASPLGLRMTIFSEDDSKSSDADFLSSIEVLILDQADIFMMQNWEHIMIIMESLNQHPNDMQKLRTDITRVRMWSLNGHSHLYRQTILFADTIVDNHRGLIRNCRNFAGKVQVLNTIEDGSIKTVLVRSELILMKALGHCDRDARFKFFIDKVLPQYRSSSKTGTLLYIPDYCDYLRLVTYLTEDGGASTATINEYMVGENAKVAKARSNFFDGKKQFLLYTERFHYYRRYIIKGIRHILFYSLPTYPHFFSELCNFMMESNQNPRLQNKKIGSHTVTALYQKSDLSRLLGILGSEHASDIVKSDKHIHMAVLG